MEIDRSKLRRILAVRNDRFGEFLLNIPAFRALKESFPEAELTVVVDGSVKELAAAVPFIDRIIEWSCRKHNLIEVVSLSARLKKERFDLAVMLNPSKEFNIATYLAAIPLRIGYARKWDFLLTHKLRDEKYLGLKHEVEYNLELVAIFGARTQDKSLTLQIKDWFLPNKLGINQQDRVVAIHPFTSDPIKQWPLNNFQWLARKITKELGIKVAIIGKVEEGIGRGIGIEGPLIIDLVNKTSLTELACLLKRCALLVSGDSGPVHLAECVGTKVIALFRNDIAGKSPKRWGPRGKDSIIIESPDIAGISPDEVFKTLGTVLKPN